MPFRILGKFVYPTLPKSLGILLVLYPKRTAVEVKPKKDSLGITCCTVLLTGVSGLLRDRAEDNYGDIRASTAGPADGGRWSHGRPR